MRSTLKMKINDKFLSINTRSKDSVSHLLKFLLDLLACPFKVSTDLDLFLVRQFSEDLTKFSINNGFAWGVV